MLPDFTYLFHIRINKITKRRFNYEQLVQKMLKNSHIARALNDFLGLCYKYDMDCTTELQFKVKVDRRMHDSRQLMKSAS